MLKNDATPSYLLLNQANMSAYWARRFLNLMNLRPNWYQAPPRWLLLALFALCAPSVLAAGSALTFPAATTPATTALAAAAAPAVVKSVPISDVAIQSEGVLARMQKFESQNNVDELIDSVDSDLPELVSAVALRFSETKQLLKQNSLLQRIRAMDDEWVDIKQRSDSITNDLTKVAIQLDGELKELDEMDATWSATRVDASASSAPTETVERIHEVIDTVAKTKKTLIKQRSKLLVLQSQSADISAQTADAQQMLADAKSRAMSRLLTKDSLPIWSGDFWSASAKSFSSETRDNLVSKVDVIKDYVAAHQSNFVNHLLFYIVLGGILFGTRSKIRLLSRKDAELNRHQKVFQKPWLTALLIVLVTSTWFYPRAPREFWLLLGMFSVVPTVVLTRHVLEKHLHPILYVVIGLYLIDKLRAITGAVPMLSRLIFLAEAVLAIVFALWLLKISRPLEHSPPWTKEPIWQVIRVISGIGMAIILIAFGANISGYVRLSDLIGNSAILSAYMAIFLYALTRIGEGLIQAACYLPPMSALGMVKHHRLIITRHIDYSLKWVAFIYWVYLTLNSLGVLQSVYESVNAIVDSSIHIGSLVLSVGDVLAFFFMIWAANKVSQFLRFILQEEMFPKMRLARGMPYAVLTIVHYVIIVIGMVLALGALGIDMTKFTILAGAFSVGIGFGLQNIVNNFVSGLILLFERPIEVGDTIEMEGITGRITRIGIRASTVLSSAGSEVIIPNGKLISDKVINWTLSGSLRQVNAVLTLKAGAEASAVQKIMLDIASRNEQVVDSPPPLALITRRGFDAYDFELRVWTDALNSWAKLKSDLITEINDTLLSHELAKQAQASQLSQTSTPETTSSETQSSQNPPVATSSADDVLS